MQTGRLRYGFSAVPEALSVSISDILTLPDYAAGFPSQLPSAFTW